MKPIQIDNYPVSCSGHLTSVTYRNIDGKLETVEWTQLKKVEAGKQLCLVAKDSSGRDVFLSVVRLSTLPLFKKLNDKMKEMLAQISSSKRKDNNPSTT